MTVQRRKLIEVSLPLEAINLAAAHEKSVPRKGHPATMHLWWARRPLAAARAVLFAQLVDDPSSHEDTYRADARQRGIDGADEQHYVDARIVAERERLHAMIRELVKWENTTDEKLLRQAHEEILASTAGDPPPILDPFAGGGTIPLEAQRLGLEAHASDLNPVAVLINKALIEIPPKFAGRSPVFPGTADERMGDWPRATGLAEDVRRYGAWMRDEAEKRIGHLYPNATLPDGSEATVIAWIWARTVVCPNPACGIRLPLVRSWWLGKKKGKEAFVVPKVVGEGVTFEISHDREQAPTPSNDGTIKGQNGAVCIGCGSTVELAYIRAEGVAGRRSAQLMAVVAAGARQRIYLPPNQTHIAAADVSNPVDNLGGQIAANPRWFSTPAHGMTHFADLFTPRQLIALTIFSDLISEARECLRIDAMASGINEHGALDDGGTAATAYADAVATYLAFALSKLADWSSSLCTWIAPIEGVRDTFARQALPMTWDFTEINPLSSSVGNFFAHIEWVSDGVRQLPAAPPKATVDQASALDVQVSRSRSVISTDPPYYDNIGYSDLSDFFYVWLRRSLGGVYPKLLSTLLVPKAEELVANPYRHGGKAAARGFFEDGFTMFFSQAREHATHDFPITVYYAFKQTENDGTGTASTGWETLLDGMLRAGWTISSTWPMRSERKGRMISVGTNALASSIVLALRPRPADAPVLDRRGFVAVMRQELPERLRDLQQGNIAPVDLPQAAIGPGMAVYSRYDRVVEPDGTRMPVREALRLINGVLAEVLSEQEGDFDSWTRWCVKWFESRGFGDGPYGDAENLANAYNVSMSALARSGAVRSGEGVVTLLSTAALPEDYDPRRDDHLTIWEVVMHLAKAVHGAGLDRAAEVFRGAVERDVDMQAGRELAYLLFSIAERRKDSATAQLFNDLVTSWPDILDATGRAPGSQQSGFDLDDL